MRTNDGVWKRSLCNVVLAASAIGLAAASASAQTRTVNLYVGQLTQSVMLPNGSTVGVPMWGFGCDGSEDANGNSLLDPGEDCNGNGVLDTVTQPPTVPGPRITLAPGEQTLEVHLRNALPSGSESVSIVIPGQAFAATPVSVGGRIVSMTAETAPGASATYTFDNMKPGTYLYESGSHPAVQVQMGLYGALTKDQSAGNAYLGVGYANEVVLVYSEIDQALHEAVRAGTYGTTAGPTSTIDYRPSLFLINGQSYSSASAAAIAAGTAGQATLLRMVNAGLRTHAPVLDNGSLRILAEDGNKLPFAKDQAALMLAAGKTHDALWTPAAPGAYSLYDRMLGLNAPGQGSAGMLAKLRVAAAGAPPAGAPVAVDDRASGVEDGPPITGNVLSNDTNAATALLVASPRAGTLTFAANGTFSYTPSPNFFGIDEFSYRAVNASSVQSAPALVTITVAGVPDAPVTSAQDVGVDAGGNVTVTLSATDADGDPLQYYLRVLPTRGKLSYIDPASKVQTPIVAANLKGGAQALALPGGVVIYTPNPGYPVSPAPSGTDQFRFDAFDGVLWSTAPAAGRAINLTVYAVETAADAARTQPVALAVVGGDGTPITAYRWTLEEDVTYKVIPGVPDPNTLAVSFHRSYMPVKDAGCWGTGCASPTQPKVDPTKRYFVSVLPTQNTYSNSGAEIEAGATSVTVTAAKLPLPTARIRVRVFQDNAPLNGMWDSTEPGLAGFQVTIDDAGGTYGASGGHQSTDAFGNKLGTTYKPCPVPGTCESYEVAQLGDGFVLSDADGYAVIENLVMGKYTVKVRAPGGDKWIQTTTIEGQPGIDAWVKPNEPQFFTEFGPPGPHVFVGFTRVTNSLPTSGGYAISGRVTNLRQSRPPAVAQFSGAPFDAKKHTRTWVALNSGATGGNLLYAQPTNEDGSFQIAHVPNGSYQLMVFDSALDIIIGSAVVNVTGAAKNVGDVAVFPWFTNLYAYVFDDVNGDGIHQASEPGIPDQALNIRFRDGSIYQSLSTAENGFKAFNEVFPFFAWMVAEVDYTRFHSTGLTVVVDAGGDASATGSNAYNWQAQAGLPPGLIPPETLNPQLQPENSNLPFRTESGAETPFLLLEGFQGFIGQSTVMLWGKAPYAPAGSIPADVNVAPFDDFPGPGDTDGNGDGKFNTDLFNGGIAGIVHYAITRAENDPRWAAAENWEPGVSDVRVQLWDANRTHLLNEVTTDNWNDSVPDTCQWPNNTPYVYQGRTTDCFDGLRNFNQARPALFDGGYAFSTILTDGGSGPATFNNSLAQRQATGAQRPIPAGKYVVKIILPPGYRLQKEEDKNVDFGDTYVPQQFWLTGYPLADAGGAGDAQPAPTVTDNALIAPFCVGQLHEVPATLSLFPGQQNGTYAGEMRPLCDAKLVTLRDGQQVAPDFHLFTEAPVAGHIYGMVLDDTTNEFDPNAPTFGEKYAVPFVGVAIRDWQGREITRTYSDQYGMYNALVPSTYTANPPMPSGVSPSILSACINPPTMPGPGGSVVPDPHFQKQYSHFCYPLQYLPGKTTYLDTPVLPTGAFTGNGTLPVDAELPNHTPVIASVTGPGVPGPYIVDQGAANNASRTIVITSAANLTVDGLTEVQNPAWAGSANPPKLIKRDYGFGASGTVRLGSQALAVSSWTSKSITAIVPTGARTGQLSVETGGRRSVLGVTLSVATPQMHSVRPPKVVAAGQSIQPVIDAATPGDLVLVAPGIHEEMVVMTRPVRLQGAGALTTAINVVTTPAENIQAWLDKMGNLLLSTPAYLLPNQPAMTPAPFQPGDVSAVVGDEGPGVMVLSKDLAVGNGANQGRCLTTQGQGNITADFAAPRNEAYCLHNENYPSTTAAYWRPNARIDGFSLIGASNAPGALVNGYAHYLEVSNNKIYTNSGTYAGGIQIGHAGAAAPFSDEDAHNDNVAIHNNMVTQNAANETGGGGGIVLGTGSTNYTVKGNFVAANLTAGNGGGIAHIGRSEVGVIDANTVVFNESFVQATGTNGGGIFIGGTPVVAGGSTLGSGQVEVTNNLVQGNAASGGDGGGLALDGFTGSDRVRLFNNVIANNVAGLAGGGISVAGVPGGNANNPIVDITHNTVVDNDSTATAGGAFSMPLNSTPQPAGIAGRGSMARVRIANSIVWHNRTFFFGECSASSPCGTGSHPISGPPGGLFAEKLVPGNTYWDLAALGTNAAGQFSPSYSVLTAATQPLAFNWNGSTWTQSGSRSYSGSNSTTAPSFVNAYFNTSRQNAYVIGETNGEATLISVPAALDEGGNFIRPQYGPLSLENPNNTPGPFFGNYHLTSGSAGLALCGPGGLFGGSCSSNAQVPGALLTDFDQQPRSTTAPHRGMDQVVTPIPTTPVPQR